MRLKVLWTPNGGRLVVAMPDRGVLIRCEQATDTFVETIKRIGIEEVKALNMGLGVFRLYQRLSIPSHIHNVKSVTIISRRT